MAYQIRVQLIRLGDDWENPHRFIPIHAEQIQICEESTAILTFESAVQAMNGIYVEQPDEEK